MPGIAGVLTEFAQALEVPFQLAQFADAAGDVADVLVEQFIYAPAVFRRRILEAQQQANLVERHVQAAAVADEAQPVRMRGPIDAVVAVGARGFGQQALALVIADGLHLGAGMVGEFSDFHGDGMTHSVVPEQHRIYALILAP